MKALYFFIIGLALGLTSLQADSLFLAGQEDPHIIVNNRVLAHVNGKPITVLDVMKKMDIYFLKQFPEYTSAPQARFQYYQVNWRHVLQELVDKELILADAQENKIPISSGDVRQEMEVLFGPNIIANLDKIGLGFDEAFKIVQGDLLIRKMISFRVNNKAFQKVIPQQVYEAFEEFAAKNTKQETWHYQVVTIRNSDASLGAETAELAYHLLSDEKIPLAQLYRKLQEKQPSSKSSRTVSDPYYHTENDVSEIIKEPLKELIPGNFCKPIAQKSRTDNSTLFRIIYLQEKVEAGAIAYNEIASQLRIELLEKAVAQESEAYLKKLRHHYAIPDSDNVVIPENFQPFQLKS